MRTMNLHGDDVFRAAGALLLAGAVLLLCSGVARAGQKSCQVVVVNQSPVVLSISESGLAKGAWTHAPAVGQAVVRGKPVTWDADMKDGAVSGFVTLTPVSGGRLVVTFAWEDGEAPAGDASCEGCGGLSVWTTRRDAPNQATMYVNVGGM